MENKDAFDAICSTALRCFVVIFVGTYLLWWLVLDGPAKWDKKFAGKIENIKKEKKVPIYLEDPTGVFENNKK